MAFESLVEDFVSSVLELSSILSFSHNLSHLEYSWRTLAYIVFGERRKRKVGKKNGTNVSRTTVGFLCRYRVKCMISFLVLA